MENNTINITISKEDKVLYDYFIDQGVFDIDEDDEKKEVIQRVKNARAALKRAVDAYQSYIEPQCSISLSHISPKALERAVKNKNKEELANIRGLLVEELLRLTRIFNDRLDLIDIRTADESWEVKTNSALGYIALYSNYISMIDSLISNEKQGGRVGLEGLLKTISMTNSINKELSKRIPEYMEQILSPEEVRVISLRYGLIGPALSLEEVSREMGNMTREKVRQVESKALLKLKQALVNSEVRVDEEGNIEIL